MKKISFCTVAMNRLAHVKQTLQKNILDNGDYPNVEFILLDYNSSDGLTDWIKHYMREYLDSGILKVFRTTDPIYFHRSHSRNMAFQLATGDILCNIDADNYTGNGFATYLNDIFSTNEEIVLCCIPFPSEKYPDYEKIASGLGRMACTREAFAKVDGYDERFASHGFEDYDVVNRIELAGYQRKFIDPKYLHGIEHELDLRLKNEAVCNTCTDIFMRYLSPSASEVVYIFNDGHYDLGSIVNKAIANASQIQNIEASRKEDFMLSIEDETWCSGTWEKINEDSYTLGSSATSDTRPICLSGIDMQFPLPNHHFFRLNDEATINYLIYLNSQLGNRGIMLGNWNRKQINVNSDTIGKGNFIRIN